MPYIPATVKTILANRMLTSPHLSDAGAGPLDSAMRFANKRGLF